MTIKTYTPSDVCVRVCARVIYFCTFIFYFTIYNSWKYLSNILSDKLKNTLYTWRV